MSPGAIEAVFKSGGFPRVSGDEPFAGDLKTGRRVFSPRERG